MKTTRFAASLLFLAPLLSVAQQTEKVDLNTIHRIKEETLGRNFPPSTLLFIGGLVDARAKVELEVTAFVPN